MIVLFEYIRCKGYNKTQQLKLKYFYTFVLLYFYKHENNRGNNDV